MSKEERTVGSVVDNVEARLKPGLKGRDQHLGFCKALAGVKEEAGDMPIPGPGDMLVRDAERAEVGVPASTVAPVCPYCTTVMERTRATTESGKVRNAWLCECDPDDFGAEPAESSEAGAEVLVDKEG
jgi:hypothetical protein